MLLHYSTPVALLSHSPIPSRLRYTRPEAQILTIILSNGATEDSIPAVSAAAADLRRLSNSTFALSSAREPNLPTLLEYTGCVCRVFGEGRVDAFLAELRDALTELETCDYRPQPPSTPAPFDPGFGYPGKRVAASRV